MKRLATLVLAAGFSLSSLVAMGQGASATPFADVPANHWAYQAIQSLAADGLVEGYPDGKFKGDRPLSRYEMAVLVARVIAKVQANGAGYASKADLDKLQKLIDALKDELDSLGVRVTNVEDALDALDKRTKFAQSIQLHGSLFHNFSQRQSQVYPHTIVNGTGAAQTLYYGGVVAAGRTAGIDPFVEAYIRSDESNAPNVPAATGDQIRFDDRLTFTYAVTDNLTVSLPVHIINYNYGGDFTPGQNIGIQPDILVHLPKAGAISNLYLRFGALDNMQSSRLGLTYRAPDASQQGPAFEYPTQPYQKGFMVGGVLNGLTEFQASFSRVDQTLINTQTGLFDPNGSFGTNGYFFYTARPQTGYTQTGPPGSLGGSLKSNTFNASGGVLSEVYLSAAAQIGTVYISQFNGSLFNSSGQLIGGAGPAAPPGFTYNQAYNSVFFPSALPAGSSVTISYVSLGASANTNWQRYDANVRINQKIKGLPGAEVGLSFNRLFDYDDVNTTADFSIVRQASPTGYGLVSDTVLGLDAQVPLAFLTIGGDKSQHPTIYGETAFSKYSPDYHNIAAVTDSAAVVGVRLKIFQFTGSLQYQVVGANFIDGAPTRFFGNPPQLFNYSKLDYLPQFFGYANNVGINQQFDKASGLKTSVNPNLTYIYPVFNPFVASGSQFFSAFAPNAQGETLNLNVPFRIGGVKINGRLLGQHLSEVQANSLGTSLYANYINNGTLQSSQRMTLDKVDAGAQFNLPLFGQSVAFNLAGSVERLGRNDKTATPYLPLNPGTLTADPAAAAAAAGNPTIGNVPIFANYVNMYHTTLAAAAALPVTKDVVFGATYNSQLFHGSYGTTLNPNISERKDTYVGSVTYNIPKTTSAVQFALRNYKYTDYVLPTFNNVENKEDVNFIIRF